MSCTIYKTNCHIQKKEHLNISFTTFIPVLQLIAHIFISMSCLFEEVTFVLSLLKERRGSI